MRSGRSLRRQSPLRKGVSRMRRILVSTLVLLVAGLLGIAEPLAATAPVSASKQFKVVTRSFGNPAAIGIPDSGLAGTILGLHLTVSGLKKGRIKDVDLTLHGFSHTRPDDVDVMLASPDFRRAIVLADAGGGVPVSALTLTLDDEARAPLPEASQLTSGRFQPANLPGDDPFVGAIPPSGAVALSTFNGANPNGEWSLYVYDDQAGNAGELTGGWELTITAKVKRKHKKHT
jgi:subtilisin-like proprotein convertase family protein